MAAPKLQMVLMCESHVLDAILSIPQAQYFALALSIDMESNGRYCLLYPLTMLTKNNWPVWTQYST